MLALEHPEIGWIERTGYPSWMQEEDDEEEDEEYEMYDEDSEYEDRRDRFDD